MENKTILITGSTDGIGKQTAIDLARKGARVIIHGRNIEKVKETEHYIHSRSNDSIIDTVVGDLSSFEQIQKVSEVLHKKYDKIDVLINNAGVYQNERILSIDGFELTFAVNHLAYFLLTGYLLDLIYNSKNGKIINVASMAHASSIDFDNLQGESYYEAYSAYALSKLCNIVYTYKLARLLSSTKITVNCLHPGDISTKLLHAGWGSGGSDIRLGSETSVFLASSFEVENVSGKYFVNSQESNSSQISYKLDIQDKIWQISEKMTKFKYVLPI